MNTAVHTEYAVKTYSTAPSRAAAAAKGGSFLEAIQNTLSPEKTGETQRPDAQEYKKYLEKRFGPVTLQSVPKDQKSLDAVGKKMRGNDIYIAPNIFEKMVEDRDTASYYERKISYFFTDVIPNGRAYAQSVGLTFEPCGVVIHGDGTVTYICGGGDPPEKVAKVAAENRAKQQKRVERNKELAELSVEQSAKRRALWEQLVKAASFTQSIPGADSGIPDAGEWLRLRQLTAPEPSAEQTAGTAFFIL